MAGPTTTTENVLDEQIKEMYRSLVLDTSAILKSSSLNTYDYISLVNLQILALAYDLGKEGCVRNKLDHIRT